MDAIKEKLIKEKEIHVFTYVCNECENTWITLEYPRSYYCPFCGARYVDVNDEFKIELAKNKLNTGAKL